LAFTYTSVFLSSFSIAYKKRSPLK
jgi:hypothetical protein